MLWFLGSMIILIGIALLVILTGLLISYALYRVQPQKSDWAISPEEIAVCAFTGTAFWTLLSGSLSYLGLAFAQIRLAVIPVAILIVMFLLIKRPMYQAYKTSILRTGAILGLAFLAGGVSSLPLALKNTFRLIVDPFTYVTIADFLQTHNFITPIKSDISFPYLSQVVTYQVNGFRMGSNFFLALITSLALNLRSVEVYPAVLAWGIALNVLGLFLWMRWGLRASYRVIFLASFFLAVTPNAVQVSGGYGFFPQTFGTAGFFFAAAVLTKTIRLSNFSLKTGMLMAFAWAFLISVYSEMFPLLVVASIFPLLFAFLRSRSKKRTGNFIKTLAIFSLAWIITSNYELLRIAKAIPIQMQAQVGWPIAQDFLALWSAALSAKPLEANWSPGFVVSLVALSSLFFMGLWHILRTRQIVALSIFGVFLALAIYFLLSEKTNLRTSMWSVYKITQWSTLFFIALAFSALQNFGFLKTKILSAAVIVVCVVGIAPLISIFDYQMGPMQSLTGSKTPIQAYFQLAELIQAYNKPIAYQVGPIPFVPTYLPAYFMMNHRLQGRWGDGNITGEFQATTLPKNSDTLFFCLACPFSNPRNPLLPANSVVVVQPVISEVKSPESYQSSDATLNFLIAENKQACVTIFSTQSGETNMLFNAKLKKNTLAMSTFRIFEYGKWEQGFTTGKDDNMAVKFPLQVGDNQICFESSKKISITILEINLNHDG